MKELATDTLDKLGNELWDELEWELKIELWIELGGELEWGLRLELNRHI